jgi:hypothetical protein
MRYTRWNFDSLAFTQHVPFSVQLDYGCAAKDVEELPRTVVIMPLLSISRRNMLLNDAEVFPP